MGTRSPQRPSSSPQRGGDDHWRYTQLGPHLNEGEMAGWRVLRGVSRRARGNLSRISRETVDSGKTAGTVSVEAPRLTASAASVESREVQALLLVLSVTAGCTDIISFLGLNGLFTAHITGNFVILAARIINGDAAHIAVILSVPVFIMTV